MNKKKFNYNSIVDYIGGEIPGFEDYYKSDLSYMKGDYAPHIVFGSLTRFFLQEIEKMIEGDNESKERVGRMIHIIEELVDCGSEEIEEVVFVSFLENLDQATKNHYEYIKSILGPKSLAALKQIREGWGQEF